MIVRAGVELARDTIRAVRISGWPRPTVRALEVSWDPEQPAAGLTALREALGSVDRLTVAASLDLLHVRRLQLPPLPAAEKRRMLGLEPDRFFPVRGEDLVFWVQEDQDLVFAIRESLLTGWLPFLESIGRLESVEPAPVALARALVKARIREGCVLRNGAANTSELTVLREGRIESVRRLLHDGPGFEARVLAERSGPIYVCPWDETRAGALEDVVPPDRVQAPPDIAGVGPGFLAAYGAALASSESQDGGLVTPELAHKIARRHRRDRLVATMACAAALIFLLWSADAHRARAERHLDARIAGLREQAGEVLALQTEAEAILRQTGTLSAIVAGRPQPLEVLLGMSRLLPPTAYVRAVRTSGSEWQVDGYAKDAAALIPLFENHPNFAEARFLTGTSRLRVGRETYESFSLALEYTPTP